MDLDHRAHGAGNVTVERDLARFKRSVEPALGELVYDGLWFSPLKKALDVFMAEAQEHVAGEIRMILHGGRATVTGLHSEASLYDFNLATYDTATPFRPVPGQRLRRAVEPSLGMASARDARFGAVG